MPKRKHALDEMHEAGMDGTPTGKPRLICNPDQEPFKVFAIEQSSFDNPRTQRMRLHYPTARLYPNHVKVMVPWTVESLMNFLQKTMRRIRMAYQTEWTLSIQPIKVVDTLPGIGPHEPPVCEMREIPD